MLKKTALTAVAALPLMAVVVSGAQAQEIDDAALMEEANSLFEPIPRTIPAIEDNAVTGEKIDPGPDAVPRPAPVG